MNYVTIDVGKLKKEQKLPISMTDSFPKWILSEEKLRPFYNSGSYGEENGWVDPFSFDETWLPTDLPLPLMRPAIGALTKDGQVKYIMPALDMCVQAGGKLWWNRGINSVPLAKRWLDVNCADLSRLSIQAFCQDGYEDAKRTVQELGDDFPENDIGPWKKMWEAPAAKGVVELVETLSDDAGACVEKGFHLVVVPLPEEPLREAPKAGNRLRLCLSAEGAIDPLQDGIESTYSELNVLFRATVPGSKSEHMPQVYEELFRFAKSS
eukprot:751118-Hanusia_phi.AAC.1